MGLTTSRNLSRKAPMKGVKAVGIAPFDPRDLVVNTETDVITLPEAITTPASIARIEVKAAGNNIVEDGPLDDATRTREYVNTLTFFIPGNDNELRSQIQQYQGLLKTVFIEDYNGKIYVLGSQNGCDVANIGGGSDLQGFNIVINSKEAELMYVLAEAGATEYQAALLPVG